MTTGANLTTGVSGSEFLTESLEQLNHRYAVALVPLAFWMGLLAVLGLLGNTLVLVVFTLGPEYRNTNFKMFVVSLALVDLLTCVTLMPAEILKTRHFFSFTDPMLCKLKCFFNVFGQNVSSYVLLVTCVDRFRKVCMPLSVQICPRLLYKIMLAVVVWSVLLSLPAPILCGVSSANVTNIHNSNTTVHICAAEEQYKFSPFRFIYKIALLILLISVSVAFFVMYSLILKTIVTHWRNIDRGDCVRFDTGEVLDKENEKTTHNPQRTCPNSNKTAAGGPVSKPKVYFGPENTLGWKPGAHSAQENTIGSKAGAHSGQENTLGWNNGTHSHQENTLGWKTGAHSSSKALVVLKFNSGLNNDKLRSQSLLTNGSQKSNQLEKKQLMRSGSDSLLRASSGRKPSPLARNRMPYKTLIWLILTLVFIITYLITAALCFITPEQHLLSPEKLLLYMFFFRIYLVNNIINPIIYLCLDKRFKMSCCHIINLLRRRWRLCVYKQ